MKKEEKEDINLDIFAFFISRAILLLWDFQISEVIITIISFILW